MSLYSDYVQALVQLVNNVEYTGFLQPAYEAYLKEAAAASDSRGQEVYCDEKFSAVAQGMEMAVNIIENCGHLGKKIIWIGNGGSSAIASHGAIDYWKNGGIKSISFNEGPLLTCIGNDYGYGAVFAKPMEMFAEENDILMAISSSGQSENILRAVEIAKEKGCMVISFSGFSAQNPLRTLGDANFYVPSEHYGQVELIHGILCHGILDLLIAKTTGGKKW